MYKDVLSVEYTITMKDGEDFIFENQDDADIKFEEVRETDSWIQYYSKEWVEDENGDPEEGYVEVFVENFKEK